MINANILIIKLRRLKRLWSYGLCYSRVLEQLDLWRFLPRVLVSGILVLNTWVQSMSAIAIM